MVGDVIADRYELEELVGSGGMSSVYRAHDRLLDRRVAIKLLHDRYAEDDETIERFRREARSVAQLSHPHIVTVIDRGEDDGLQFIVFEYVDGENLKELAVRSGRLPVRRAVELAIAIADGLAFAHQNGLVHRDVKPQNVLLSREGEVKVTDFGIARSIDVDHGVTLTGTILGTSNYLSPEQASGKPVTPATDVYSLGIVLWELLTGEVPFPGDNFVTVALRHINEQPPSLPEVRRDVTPRLAAAVDRALAKDPRDRFGTMGAFAAELQACLDDLETFDPERTIVSMPAVPLPAPERRPVARGRRSPHRTLALAVVVLVALAAIAAGVLGLGGGGSHGGGSSGGGASSGKPVALRGVGDFDPQGSGGEHGDTASQATDGSPSTFWYTETYASPAFGGLKRGVGLVVDAGASTALKSLTVHSPTPGFQAAVLAGDSPSGPFSSDSGPENVGMSTTFALSGRSARYYVVWITRLPTGNKAEISEVAGRR